MTTNVALYNVWDTELGGPYPWRAQLVNYVGQFETREKAECYVAAVKKERAHATTTFSEPTDSTKKKVK